MTYHNQGGVPYNVLPPTISSQTHNYYDQSYQHRWHGGTRNKHGHARNNNTRKSTSSDIDSTSRPSSKSKNSDSRRNSTNGTKPTDTSSRNSDTSYSSRPNTPSSNTSTPRPSILKSKPTQSNQNTSNKAPITNNQNHESFNSSNDQAVDVRKKKKRFRKGRKRNIIKGDVVMEPPSKSGGRNMKNNERVLPKHVKFITEPDEQQTPSLVDQSVQATPPSNTTPQGQISHSSSVQKCGSSSETFADHTRRHHRFKNQGSTTPGYSENKLSSSVKNSNHDNQVPTEMSSMHSLMSSKTTINKDSNQEDTTLMNGSFQSRKRKGETMDRDNSVMKKSRVVPQGEASNTNQSNQLGGWSSSYNNWTNAMHYWEELSRVIRVASQRSMLLWIVVTIHSDHEFDLVANDVSETFTFDSYSKLSCFCSFIRFFNRVLYRATMTLIISLLTLSLFLQQLNVP